MRNRGQMKTRPFVLKLLGLLCLVEPLLKTLLLAHNTHSNFLQLSSQLIRLDPFLSFFEYWLLFPLAGVFLLLVKKWSYYAFFSVMGYALYLNYQVFIIDNVVSDRPLFSSIWILYFNLVILTYLLASKKLRTIFFDKSLRWWEPATRYNVSMPVFIEVKGIEEKFESQIHNISSSGIFLVPDKRLHLGEKIKMHFHILGLSLVLEGEVRNSHTFNGVTGHGVEFIYTRIQERFAIFRLLRALKLLKV